MDVQPMPRQVETPRLLLRSWSEDDAVHVRELWGERDSRSERVLSADGKPTVEEMSERLRSQLTASESSGFRLYAMQHIEDGMLGYCGLIPGRINSTTPELAFELFRRFHGNGYATEAATGVLAAADTCGRPKIWSTVREWNTASLRVLSKLGFQRTGQVEPDLERGARLWLSRTRGAWRH